MIPVLNAESFLTPLLIFFEKAPKDWEMIFLNSDSSDNTKQMIEEKGFEVFDIEKSTFHHGRSRNLLASHASGEVLLFMTQDALPCSIEDIQYLIEPIVKNEAVACYGRQLAREGAGILEAQMRKLNYDDKDELRSLDCPKDIGVRRFYFSNSFSAVRRSVFHEMGGFDESVIVNEDMELAYRLIYKNLKVKYVASAKCVHSHSYSVMESMGRYFDVGVFFKNHPEISRSKIHNKGRGLAKTALFGAKPVGVNGSRVAVLLQLMASYLGYQLGKKYKILPIFICRAISRQKNYWLKNQNL